MWIVCTPVYIVMPVNSSVQLKLCLVGPNNCPYEGLILLYNVPKPLTVLHSSFNAKFCDENFQLCCFNNMTYTGSANPSLTCTLLCRFLRWVLKTFQNPSRGLRAHWCLPDLPLWTSHTVPWIISLHECLQLLIALVVVFCTHVSIAVELQQHSRFSNSERSVNYPTKMACMLLSSCGLKGITQVKLLSEVQTIILAPFWCFWLTCRVATLAWRMQDSPVYRTSYYTLLLFFGPTLKYIK